MSLSGKAIILFSYNKSFFISICYCIQGKVLAISVDNFTQDRLADFIFWNKVKPAADPLECNPFFQRVDEEEYLNDRK